MKASVSSTEAFFFGDEVSMLARIQQMISLSILALLGMGIGYGAVTGSWLPALATAGLLVGGYAGVLATEFWLLRRSYERGDPVRPAVAQLLRAWLAETAGAPLVFLWRQPFRSGRYDDHLTNDPTAGRRGVVFVHGFFCNRGLWNPWLARLRAADVPFAAVSLAPVLGSIDDYRATIDAAVRSLEQATGLAPVIVAHSMGGLAVRAWIAEPTTGDERWHHVVTIASPHGGTSMARHARGRNVGQMRHGNPWLADLAGREPAGRHGRFTCFWGHCDNIVFPTRHATLAGADNRHLTATPHVQMAYHPEVMDEVFRRVGEPRTAPRPALTPRRSP